MRITSKIVCYDLRKPKRNYPDLYDYLNHYGIHLQVSESAWIISTDKTCKEIVDEIYEVVDSNDTVFVAELSGSVHGNNILNEQRDFHIISIG